MTPPDLYIHVRQAGHFLQWELPEFAKYFTLVNAPSPAAVLLSFGPDALEEAAGLPARARFAVLFPGFGYNPVRDQAVRDRQRDLIENCFLQIFINPGPLQIAYEGWDKVSYYPFSVDVKRLGVRRFRRSIDSLLHVSHDSPQKDWQRSESIMRATGLSYEVFPPRNPEALLEHFQRSSRRNRIIKRVTGSSRHQLPEGYFTHAAAIAKYRHYDGFVHVAAEVGDPVLIDGKYTASFIEAGVTGAILFWHDTWGLGNGLSTVFDLPLDAEAAAAEILDIRASIDVRARSRETHEEMMDTFSPQHSVRVRAEGMLELL